jgi:hypothetical protein
MDKETLQKHLQALASGKKSANTPLVEAYLADKQTGAVGRLLGQVSGSYYLSKTPLLPPSSCLPLLA